MPRREDLSTILLLGSGPIVIGQASEFDYSGVQACRELRREGYRVVLVNSTPATILTDPEVADATYIEPLTADFVERVVAVERPDAVLPTLGGQTALNVAVALAESGALARHGVELIGAGLETIRVAEDRRAFAEAMAEVGVEVAPSGRATDLTEARSLARRFGLPVLIRSSFTLGGAGSGVAGDQGGLDALVREGLAASPIGEIQVDASLLGWKEFELEVVRDTADQCVVVCSIENLDAMGVHTGDSITVAPAQTLSDPEYQLMRDTAFTVLRRVGVTTGGANVQFAVDPGTGRQLVVEMNPRVSRSSALASKATGFPIAKVAAQLAVGYTLDELRNEVTGVTAAAFEPSIDYVVTKVPRFAFEKFPGADRTLTTRMKSVGEVMALGRTFTESIGKALRSLEEPGHPAGAGLDGRAADGLDDAALRRALETPTPERIALADGALERGWSIERVAGLTAYDPWFVDQLAIVGEVRRKVASAADLDAATLRRAKRTGLSDAVIARLRGIDEAAVRARRHLLGVTPVHKTVDTCAAEFAAVTPYHYSTYEEEHEVAPSDRERVIILGSGPNRIGQGIEFDYCCVHAVDALRASGRETVMVNCNPETVSTDYDTADRLYFEPLTLEDVLAVHEAEVAAAGGDARLVGVLVQLGGQTPLRLARALAAEGVRILGTQPEAIDLAEDRGRFNALLDRLGIPQPEGAVATSPAEATALAQRIGFPVLVRPSYVLGGRAMEIVYSAEQMTAWLEANAGEAEVLVDRFLEGAVEVDVDAVFDGVELHVGGVMEHIEEAGVHSGDSACVIPPFTLGRAQLEQLRSSTAAIAEGLRTRGLINVQYALRDADVYVLEANPRASRTAPFVSKATGFPIVKAAARVMTGATIAQLRAEGLLPHLDAVAAPPPAHVAVKEAVLPFDRFPGVDTRLGPEMRSTGEVMGIDLDFGVAFAKSQAGTSTMVLPTRGTVFCSIANRDKRAMIFPVKRLAELGFHILATEGTAATLRRAGVAADVVGKHSEGGPSVLEELAAGRVDLVLNTPMGSGPRVDGYEIRTAAVAHGVPCVTTLPGILAAIQGIEALRGGAVGVRSLQAYHADALARQRTGTDGRTGSEHQG